MQLLIMALAERLQLTSVTDFQPGHTIRICTTWWDISYIIGRLMLFTGRSKLENCSKLFTLKNFFYFTKTWRFDMLIFPTQYL